MKPSYEDVFFYLDLTKTFLKKKDLIKAIRFYISEKNKINIKGHYGLLIFQEEGNPIFIIDKKDSTIITNAIEENWKTRPKEKSFFENGLFYIFSYIAETIRKSSKMNRVIIITDTPSDLSEDYTNALFNLVSKIKKFPTSIDIVRISSKDKRFFEDDVKLNILASDTNGEVFYVHDKKNFMNAIRKLVKSKQLIRKIQQEHLKIKIKKEDYLFYSRLAKELKSPPIEQTGLKCYFCKEEICPVCTNLYDIPLVCENCGTAFHNCCITNYTLQYNIGIPHIFRCPNCDILLKIKQDEIVKLEDNQMISIEDYIENENIEALTDNKNIQENVIEKSDNQQIEDSDMSQDQNSKVLNTPIINPKIIRVGGFFGKKYIVRKEGDKLVYKKISKETSQYQMKHNKPLEAEITSQEEKRKNTHIWKPSNIRSFEGINHEQILITCPECGLQITKNEAKSGRCPSCGHKF